jgi:predicted nucleotidyltransferase
MKATLEDYQSALESFLADMRRIDDDVVSVILYGSSASGDIKPGRSDMIDAYVYLHKEVFENEEHFQHVFAIMTEACERLFNRELPFHFHPFHYFSLEEINRSPAIYLPTWWSDRTSRVVLGEDVRPQMVTNESGRTVARTAFFEARRNMGHALTRYLHKEQLTEQERQRVVKSLVALKKHITVMACLVLDIWTSSAQAVQELERALPELDVSVMKKVETLRDDTAASADFEQIKQTIRETLVFVESLHDQLLDRLEDKTKV